MRGIRRVWRRPNRARVAHLERERAGEAERERAGKAERKRLWRAGSVALRGSWRAVGADAERVDHTDCALRDRQDVTAGGEPDRGGHAGGPYRGESSFGVNDRGEM